jgi:hypothetical protein
MEIVSEYLSPASVKWFNHAACGQWGTPLISTREKERPPGTERIPSGLPFLTPQHSATNGAELANSIAAISFAG